MMWTVMVPLLAALAAVGSGGMVGGWHDLNVNDTAVQDMLRFAVVEHNKQRNDMYLSQVMEVIRAESQVVAGMNYRITVKMGKTPCRNGSANDACVVHETEDLAMPYQCTFTVYHRPWQNEIKLTKQKC